MRRMLQVTLGTVLAVLTLSMASREDQKPSEDPVKLSPNYYTVRLENDRVRALEFRLKPGETEAMHSHRSAFVVHFLTDAMVRTTLPDGTKTETTITKGETAWRDPALSHSVENIGRTDLQALIVELKRP